MPRRLIPVVALLAVAGPAVGQPKKKEETVTKEWVTQTAALPANQQVETVTAKLRELFGPHVGLSTAEIKDGAVVEAVVAGMQYIDDVGPLAAFKKLEKLTMSGGKVKDLVPLKGLPLKSLDCSSNAIAGLEPLRGMPLETLRCQNQNLRKPPDDWLAPVAALKGLKTLYCSGVRVIWLGGSGLKLEVLSANDCTWSKTGIGLLRGMPLRELHATGALSVDPMVSRGQPVAGTPGDVAPLKTLTTLEILDLSVNKAIVTLDWVKPLTKLQSLAVNETGVSALDPLKGAKALTTLSVHNSFVSNLEPLKGLKLTSLDVTSTLVVNLGPLEKLPLETLALQNTKVRDLKPLANLPLKGLNLSSSAVDDLSPLAGLKLTDLSVNQTAVKNLGPLRGMPLKYLNISELAVNDLSPLKGLPIEYLGIGKPQARDLDVLTTLEKLNRVDCDLKTPGLIPVLRKVKTLQQINNLPAAEQLQ